VIVALSYTNVMPAGEHPRVGISRCLLGDKVRYNGTHKRDTALIDAMSRYVEWVPVCPEVEIGMGTPREPMELVARADGLPWAGERVRLLCLRTGEDWTDRMQAWAHERVEALKPLKLSGFIFKARSPSCGIDGVLIRGGEVERVGQGLFAQVLVAALPDVLVADEEGLIHAADRDNFLKRIRAYNVHAT